MQILNRHTTERTTTHPEKVMQFGGGNFLRAFADSFIQILNETTHFNAGVVVIKPTSKGDYQALRSQDGLFHVVLKGLKNGQFHSQTKLITCVNKVVHPYKEWEEYLALAENPDIRFVLSNTTEAGIIFNENDTFGDAPPKEFPAKLTAWLYHRYQCFLGDESKGCIFLPCELIEKNGETLRQCILQYAEAWELGWDFQKWIFQYNFFCNTLVDRIVTGYPKNEAEHLQKELGFKDQLLVAGEIYHSWLIEAPNKVLPELPFKQTDLSVRFVEDLTPFRKMKVRLLNGAHTSMVPVAYLMGHQTVGNAINDPLVGQFIQDLLYKEVGPTLEISQEEIKAYTTDLLDRFGNPSIQHSLLSISLNSMSKFKTRLLPSLLEFQQKKQDIPKRIVFSLAALIHFYRGFYKDLDIPLKDTPEVLDFYNCLWNTQKFSFSQIAEKVLQNEAIWGQDLNAIPLLQETLVHFLTQIDHLGVKVAIKDLIISSVSEYIEK